MARSGLVGFFGRCYCGFRLVEVSSPDGDEPDWEVFYANDAPVLCGDRLRGGTMDF